MEQSESRLLVRDVMTPQVEVIDPREKLSEAARRMRDLDVGSLPVCYGGRLVGVVTDRDIAVRGVAGEAPQEVRVESVMSAGVVLCYEDQSVEEAAAIMREEQVRRLPVLNRQKQLVGIVSLGDLAVRTDSAVSGQVLEEVSQPSQENAPVANAAGASSEAPDVNSLLERPDETPPPPEKGDAA